MDCVLTFYYWKEWWVVAQGDLEGEQDGGQGSRAILGIFHRLL